ncbi:hypothetical protein Tco_1441372, partial [Tanacetum coccineum]
LEELATTTKSTMMKDQVFVEREVDTDLKFEKKLGELCLEVADTVKERPCVIEELEIVRVLRRVQ